MPKIFYKDTNFRDKTLDMIAWANKLIEDYAQQGLSLTLRQLYYRFVAAGLIENSLKSYSRLGDIVNKARLAGLMDWNAIEDRGRNLVRHSHWDDPSDIIAGAAQQYRVDLWEGQEYRVEVWVEKQALESVIGQAASKFDCPYFACKGYTSQSEMWRSAMRFNRYIESGQRPVVIHLGDHDPSGIDMTRDIFDRLNELFGSSVKVDRIALNMNQVRKHNPPPNPAKLTDSRAQDYIKNFGESSWELDALEPSELRRLIQKRIKKYLDVDTYDEQLKLQQQGRDQLQSVSDHWTDVTDYVRELED